MSTIMSSPGINRASEPTSSFEHFLYYCGTGELQQVKAILEKGMVNVNGQDNEGVTGLQLAASRGDIQLARTLLEHGALPDLANGSGWTPLLLASWHGHADLAALLLQHRARANQPNRLGVRPLTAAAWGGHLPLVRLLLQHGALLEPGPLDLSPLAAASFQGHCAVVRFLLDCGLDVNHSLPHTGVTSLMAAAAADRQPVAQILVEWGADVDQLSSAGHSALEIATALGHHTVKSYLDGRTSARQPAPQSEETNLRELMQAIKDDDQSTAKSLLIGNLKLGNAARADDGLTPLMYAAMLGRAGLVELLITCGANLNLQDSLRGWTALMHAVYCGHSSVVKNLLEAGAEVEIANHDGLMAFDLACLLDKDKTDIMALVARKTNSLTRTLSPKLKSMFQDPKRSFRTKSSLKSNLKAWFQLKMPRQSSPCPLPLSPTPGGLRLSISSPKNSPSPSPVVPPVLPGPDVISMPGIRAMDQNFTSRPSFKPVLLLRNWKQDPGKMHSVFPSGTSTPCSPASGPPPGPPARTTSRRHNGVRPPPLTPRSERSVDSTSSSSSHNAVVALLEEMCLQKYIEKFRSQEIDLEAFRHLTESDLDELGVLSLQPRQSLLALIRQLRPKV